VRIGVPGTGFDDLLADARGRPILAAAIELARHFDGLGRRDVHAAVKRLADRLVDVVGASSPPLRLRISRSALVAGLIRGGALSASPRGGLGRALGLAVGHGRSFTRKCRQIKGLAREKAAGPKKERRGAFAPLLILVPQFAGV